MSLQLRKQIDGAWIVNKHRGLTSAALVHKFKNRLKLKKVGHAGTLDPSATGVMIILSGQATRVQDLFSNERKVYSGHIQFGIETDTNDLDGEVIFQEDNPKIFSEYSKDEIIEVIKNKFSGLQKQVPPHVSALKINGKRNYHLVRKGVITELPARTVDIRFEELNFIENNHLYFKADVSKGTYIRSLARDIGYAFDNFAIVQSLHREQVGKWSISQSSELREIVADNTRSFIPFMELLSDIPKVDVDQNIAKRLRNGDFYLLKDLGPKEKKHQYAAITCNNCPVTIIEQNYFENKWEFRMVFN